MLLSSCCLLLSLIHQSLCRGGSPTSQPYTNWDSIKLIIRMSKSLIKLEGFADFSPNLAYPQFALIVAHLLCTQTQVNLELELYWNKVVNSSSCICQLHTHKGREELQCHSRVPSSGVRYQKVLPPPPWSSIQALHWPCFLTMAIFTKMEGML